MVDEGKWVMMWNSMSTSTCHATLPSMCRSMSSKLTFQDDVSCHINIHVSCHINSFHIRKERVDGQGSVDFVISFGLARELVNGR
jgi:hypothetical protein